MKLNCVPESCIKCNSCWNAGPYLFEFQEMPSKPTVVSYDTFIRNETQHSQTYFSHPKFKFSNHRICSQILQGAWNQEETTKLKITHLKIKKRTIAYFFRIVLFSGGTRANKHCSFGLSNSHWNSLFPGIWLIALPSINIIVNKGFIRRSQLLVQWKLSTSRSRFAATFPSR